eukprot:5134818-Prymnesium_polylepis.1
MRHIHSMRARAASSPTDHPTCGTQIHVFTLEPPAEYNTCIYLVAWARNTCRYDRYGQRRTRRSRASPPSVRAAAAPRSDPAFVI